MTRSKKSELFFPFLLTQSEFFPLTEPVAQVTAPERLATKLFKENLNDVLEGKQVAKSQKTKAVSILKRIFIRIPPTKVDKKGIAKNAKKNLQHRVQKKLVTLY